MPELLEKGNSPLITKTFFNEQGAGWQICDGTLLI